MGAPSAVSPETMQAGIQRFIEAAKSPALLEPGEEPLPLTAHNHAIELANGRLTLQAWDDRRSVARRITAVEPEAAGRLELAFERFGKRKGVLSIVDTARLSARHVPVKAHRNVFREEFRLFLSRQFCGWKIAGISAEPDLEHSLSPSFPRALVRHGTTAWAAIAAPPDCAEPAGCLTYGLIWLDYLRAREPRLAIRGLAVFVPTTGYRTTALRLTLLDPSVAAFLLYVYSEDGHEQLTDPGDCGNLDTSLSVCHRPAAVDHPLVRRLSALPHVETIVQGDGSISLRVNGLPFAIYRNEKLYAGLDTRRVVRDSGFEEVAALAAELVRVRSAGNPDPANPLYRRNPEAWLESQVRANLARIDAGLLPDPLYGQVPAMAGGDRNVIDLLAVDRQGRLAVIELKASEDPHLPLQALDYWMRVEWHARRQEFSPNGYFPGVPLSPEAPRLLLVSPALRFHTTAASVLRYFSPLVHVERVGLGIEWQRTLQVVFRARGAGSPMWGSEQEQVHEQNNVKPDSP